jgi:HK97 family phage prohead protease
VRRAIPRETKLLPEPPGRLDRAGLFEGYASLFGVPDLGRDVVEPGAFAASLARRGAAGVRMLWQHDPGEPIGTWLSLVEDGRGLRVRGRLNLAVARARELEALMRDKAVDGLSIGYRVERASPDRAAGVRRLQRLDLWEISVVTFPMLPGARVSEAKGGDLPERIRDLARLCAGRHSFRPSSPEPFHRARPRRAFSCPKG